MSTQSSKPARELTRPVRVGNVQVGGGAPVSVQSMCTTKTDDPAATLAQIRSLADAGCEIVRSVEGADPGAVLFDSLAAAKARNVDVVLCDTAGRLHNKVNLMNELSKLRKIIDRELPDAAKETLLVLDATTGQNGLQQAKVFRETAGLTGIILTKLDGTAKGGICVAIAQELGVPVKFVGLGEGIDDLQPFNAEEYVKALI